jgi:CubicO group peptidase (beta-lactamase class C family)
MTLDNAHWEQRLRELATRYDVPGATLGILLGDEVAEAAHGVTNLNTGVEVTTDTLFQLGSISKVWTATLVMQLVDEGKLDLDTPLIQYLPELELADADVTRRLTMRHLLTHTSGIDGDIFDDTGRGDDCLEKYAALLSTARQNHPLAATWSYCNSGYSLAGRVVEKLTGGTWDAAVREKLVKPLNLTHTVTLPEEALMWRAAVGHTYEKGTNTVAPVWGIPRSAGPAGAVTATVRDLLAFAKMHITGDGPLSASSIEQMAAFQVELPDKHTLGDSWGLGWERMTWDGRQVIGHDGNTIGQAAFWRVLPSAGLSVTLLTNGGNDVKLFDELFREIFAELAGVAVPKRLGPPEPPVEVDVAPYAAVYERASMRMEVLAEDDGPALTAQVTGPLAELVPDQNVRYPLTGVEPGLFLAHDDETDNWIPVTFYQLPTGERYMHFGGRATPRA